jgi:hypothetical protein
LSGALSMCCGKGMLYGNATAEVSEVRFLRVKVYCFSRPDAALELQLSRVSPRR